MRGSYIKTFLVIGVAACGLAGSLSTMAQIAVDTSGSALFDFTSAPPSPSSFSTLSVGSASGTYEMIGPFETQIMTTVASAVNQPLGTTTAAGTASLARHNTVAGALETDPTVDDYNLLMATMMNNAGNTITSFKVTYDHSIPVAPVAAGEMIPGHRVFFSTTGLAGSWQPVPSLTGLIVATPGANATISGISWDAGTPAYILWADDNNAANPDAVNRIDNFVISDVAAGPALPPSITTQPVSVTVNERQVARLSVSASGAGLTYQWFLNPSTPIPGATSASYVVTNRLATSRYPWSNPSDNGTFHVVVSGTAGAPVTSGNATVTVTPDNTAPTLLYATCGPTVDQMTVELSEPLDDSTQGVTDPFIWQVRDMLGGANLSVDSVAYTDNGISTTLIFNISSTTPRDPARGYIIGLDSMATPPLDTAKTPHPLSLSATAGVKCFENPTPLVNLTNHTWQVEDSGTDLGTAWTGVSYVDSGWPKSGTGLFDAKRTATGNPPDVPWCRAAVGGQNVNTCINLSNSTTQISAAYFRTHFNFSGSPAGTLLAIHTYLDDGGVFYLNGQEFYRKDMPAGVIAYATASPRTIGDAALESTNLPAGAFLVSGDNVLAAAAHQVNLTSSDLTFGLQINKLSAVPPITLTIVDNGNGTVSVSWLPVIGTLKSSTSVTAPLGTWATVGTTSPQTVSKTGTQKFFAVQGPPEP